MSALSRLRFTPADDEMLRALWAEGHSLDAIGQRLGRAAQGVKERASRLGLPRRNNTEYTAAADAQLRVLHAAGLSHAQMGKMLGRSPSSVSERCRRLDLPHRKPGVPKGTVIKPKKAKPPVQKEQLGTWSFEPKASVNHSLEWREQVALRQAELKRAWAHAARVKALGPMGQGEAEALIAAALAAGKVTLCRPAAVAPITGGLSL
jgi:hypothetical protein